MIDSSPSIYGILPRINLRLVFSPASALLLKRVVTTRNNISREKVKNPSMIGILAEIAHIPFIANILSN